MTPVGQGLLGLALEHELPQGLDDAEPGKKHPFEAPILMESNNRLRSTVQAVLDEVEGLLDGEARSWRKPERSLSPGRLPGLTFGSGC